MTIAGGEGVAEADETRGGKMGYRALSSSGVLMLSYNSSSGSRPDDIL